MGRLEDILKSVEENKVANPPVRRNVYVADLDMTVNTDLETPDEINYATKTQVLEKPKQEYIGLKETENPFKLAYNASVDSLKNVLDKVVETVAPTNAREPFKEMAKGAVVSVANLGNLSWGATKIFATNMAMNREMFADKNALEQSYMRREITQEEYFQKLKELTAKKTQEHNAMREFIGKDIAEDNQAFNQWLQDCGFTPDSKTGKFFYDLGGSITSIGASVIAFAVTKNPLLAISLISVPEFTSTYTEAIEKGKDADTAMSAGLTNYAFVTGSEFLGGKVLWSTLSKSGFINNAIKKITTINPRLAMPLASGFEEGIQESSQEVGGELINQYYDISQLTGREIINNALYSGLQAFLGASLFGGVAGSMQFNKIFENEKKELLKLKDSNGNKLYTPEQADQIAKRTADFVQSRELQDEILNISKAERDNSLSKEARNPKEMKKMIEDNLKKMETALPEIKKELMDIKTKVKDNALGIGLDNEQATMVAEMTQARAMMYYNAFGITPLQFYYLNELEITVDENSNILSNGRETGYTVRFNESKVSQAIDSGNIQNVIQSIRTKENLDKFGNFVNKLVAEGKVTEEQRSMIYSQLADRMAEIPTTEQVVDRVREEEVDKFNQPAYHGTPHRFDEFSTDKIGTGEGAQAHGWGLYFAEDKETAERYREVLARWKLGLPVWVINAEGNVYELEGHNDLKEISKLLSTEDANEDVLEAIEKGNYQPIRKYLKDTIKYLQENIDNEDAEEIEGIDNKKLLKELQSIDVDNIKITQDKGQTFQVEIPESDVLLDEDKTFDEQPEKVKEAIREIEKDDEDGELYNDLLDTNEYGEDEIVDRSLYLSALDGVYKEGDTGATGKEIYNSIVLAIRDKYGVSTDVAQKEASLILNKYGIKGISYDGYEDGRAYVIFDDKAVKILEKFYQPNFNAKDLREIKIIKAFKRFLNLVYTKVKPHKKLTQKEGEEYFRNVKSVEHNELGDTNFSINTVGKLLGHKGFDFMTIIKELPSLYENSILIESGTEKTYPNKEHKQHNNIAFWHNTLNKFKIGDDTYVIRFTVTENKVGKNKPKGTKGDKNLHSAHISEIDIEKIKEGETMNTVNSTGRVPPSDNILAEYIEIVNRNSNVGINYNDSLDNIIKQVENTKVNIVRERLENSVPNPVDENDYTTKLPKNWGKYKKDFKLIKGNIYKINNSSYGIYVGTNQNGEEQFIGYDWGNGFNTVETVKTNGNVLVDVSQNYPQNNQVNNNRGEVIPRDINTPVTEQTKSIINVFSGGDRSTIIHEMAHIFLRDIEIIENQGGVQDEQFRKIKATLDKWLGKKEGQKYTVEQQEKFASGFETYMATGQAPKEELKGVFDYFKKWMSQIYDSVKNMIPITPEVKNMFDEILTLQPVEQTPQTQTEGGNNGNNGNIVPVTPDAKDLGKIERKRNTSIVDFANKYIQPISTRLGAIDPRLEYEMKMFEARLSIRQAKYKDASLDFLKQTDELKKKSKQDYLNFDRALKNRDVNTINRITEKYPELKSSYEKIREMLDGIKAELKVYGVEGIENYFPRKINNIDGLMSYLEGTDNWSEIERAMKQSDPNYKNWTEEKKAEFVASYLQGYRTGVKTKSAHTKQRKIDIVTDEMDRYYENSSNSLLEYINNISNFLETARLLKLGKDEVYEMTSVSKDGTINLDKVIKNIESILGTYVKDLVKDKKLTREQEKELAQLIRARFNFQNTNNIVSVIKSFGYLATLGNINAVITQFGDLSYSIDNAGIFGTLRAIFGKKKITMEDLGIDHPAEDFADGIGIMQKILNGVLKTIGFKSIDSLGKNTYIATTFMKYKSMIEKNEQKAFDDIARRYGDEFAKNIIDDIKNDRLSENIYLFAHSELSRVQPISMSEVPEAYLNSPTGRIFYSLKTFWIKQFNRIITDNSRLIKEGIKEKNAEKVKEGAVSMAKLIILFVVLGSGTDMLKDLIYLRKIDLEDTVFDNFLKLLGVSRYTVYKAREQGTWSVIADQIFSLPVGQMFDSFTSELNKVSKGKLKVKDLRIASNIPIVGNPYYWWLGGGRLKEKKKNKRRVL